MVHGNNVWALSIFAFSHVPIFAVLIRDFGGWAMECVRVVKIASDANCVLATTIPPIVSDVAIMAKKKKDLFHIEINNETNINAVISSGCFDAAKLQPFTCNSMKQHNIRREATQRRSSP